MKFAPARYAFDGQEVWIPWPSPDKPRQGARVHVACAMGTSVRVVNESLGIDQWRRVDSVYVREDEPKEQEQK